MYIKEIEIDQKVYFIMVGHSNEHYHAMLVDQDGKLRTNKAGFPSSITVSEETKTRSDETDRFEGSLGHLEALLLTELGLLPNSNDGINAAREICNNGKRVDRVRIATT